MSITEINELAKVLRLKTIPPEYLAPYTIADFPCNQQCEKDEISQKEECIPLEKCEEWFKKMESLGI